MLEIKALFRNGQKDGIWSMILLSKAVIAEGKFAQFRPPWNPAREGMPEASFLRIDRNPIFNYSLRYNFDICVVIDASLLGITDVKSGLKKDARLIVNGLGSKNGNIIFIPLGKIAKDEGSSLAYAIAGCLCGLSDMVSISALDDIIKKDSSDKNSEAHIKTIKRAFDITILSS